MPGGCGRCVGSSRALRPAGAPRRALRRPASPGPDVAGRRRRRRLSSSPQSTAAPSDTAAPSAMREGSSGSSVMPHLDSEPDERAADRDANCRQRGLAGEVGDLCVVEAQLHACDDQLAIRFAQALECLRRTGRGAVLRPPARAATDQVRARRGTAAGRTDAAPRDATRRGAGCGEPDTRTRRRPLRAPA